MQFILEKLNELKEDIEDDICGNWNKSVDARITNRLVEIVKLIVLQKGDIKMSLGIRSFVEYLIEDIKTKGLSGEKYSEREENLITMIWECYENYSG